METIRVPMEQLAEVLLLQLREGGKAELTVTGSSMRPMLHHGKDKVQLSLRKPVHKDVILYKRDSGRYILHRIVRVKDGVFICAGDNQWETEEIRPDQVLATMDHWYHRGKLKTPADLGYRFYVWLWVGLLPVRRPILAVRRVCGKIRTKIKKRKS